MSDMISSAIDTVTDYAYDAIDTATDYYEDAKSRLMGDGGGSATVRFRNCGGIVLDAVTDEDHTSELTVAENTLETGTKAADHAALEPKEITVTGIVVGYEPTSAQENFISEITGLRDLGFLDDLGLPSVVSTVIQSTRDMVVNKLATFIDWGALDSAISSALTPWLPGFSIAEQLKTSDNLRIEELYRSLLDFQKNIVYCSVDTGIFLYENMLLVSIRVKQQKDGSAEFTLRFREVVEVPIKVTNAVAAKSTGRPANSGTTKSGRAESQGSDTENKNINNSTSVEDKRGVGVTLGDMMGINVRGIFG